MPSSKVSAELIAPPQTLATQSPKPANQTGNLPLRSIPGGYGLPLIGALKDRLDYFYHQGKNKFFSSRIQKYDSTVFRTNMPPGPFITFHSKVVALLDAKSFPVLFDVSKVEKKNLFTGTYMPSKKLTGGYRVLSYLDPSEEKHTKIKQFLFNILSSRKDHVIPEFHECYTELFEKLEEEVSNHGKVKFNDPGEVAAFKFLALSYFGADPASSKLGDTAPKKISIWVLFNLHPVLSLGLPQIIEDPLMHTFRLPPCLVKSTYQSLYDFFHEHATSALDEAEKLGIAKEEACHNLLFATCFNTFGGIKILFPDLLKWLGQAGIKLQNKLGQEIRSVLSSSNNQVTLRALESMSLTKSVVYEALRIEPPVSSQYGRAKTDFTIESHDYSYNIKKGEMLFGFQPFATKDPKIFDTPEDFVPDRFVGEGEKLLQYVLWSNGPETESPTLQNKQCAGKDFVVLVARLFVVELFRRYDSFEVEVGSSPLGSNITLTSLKRAAS